MFSVMCLRLSDVSVICRVTYFQFPIQSAFFNISVARPHQYCGGYYWFSAQYRTSDTAENLGKYLSCAERTAEGKDFELTPTVKMETRHPVEVSLV